MNANESKSAAQAVFPAHDFPSTTPEPAAPTPPVSGAEPAIPIVFFPKPDPRALQEIVPDLYSVARRLVELEARNMQKGIVRTRLMLDCELAVIAEFAKTALRKAGAL